MFNLEHDVVAFVAEFTWTDQNKIKQESTLFGDLRIAGADGWELIEEFGKKFSVDLSDFRSDNYFGPEGTSGLAPFLFLWYLVSWPFKKADNRSPEEQSGVKVIRIADLIASAQAKRWTVLNV